MPDVGDLSDTYTLNLEVKDGITPAIDATAAKMAGFEDERGEGSGRPGWRRRRDERYRRQDHRR